VLFHWVLALFVVLLARWKAPALASHEAVRVARNMQPPYVDLHGQRPRRPAQAMPRAVPAAIAADLQSVGDSTEAAKSINLLASRRRARRNAERFLRR
jgi:hypothetical protein